jgi:uncharacterized delta-60 repeat protein
MKKTLLFLFALVTIATQAQSPGDIAQSYGATPGFNNIVRTIAQQADGKTLVGGNFTTYNGVNENKIIRLNADGSKDTSFIIGTLFGGNVYTIVPQADGKILIGGDFTSYNGVTENRIIRLNSDGSKDATFATGTGFNNIVYSIALQTDGKIIVGGAFSLYNEVTEKSIIRLNSDGSKDATFATGTGFVSSVRTIKQQANGKILIGGNFSSYNGVTENRIIRLNSDGSKDATFTTGTGFNSVVYAIELQDDGKIIVGGAYNTYNGVNESKIIRLNTDGSKDAIFVTGTGISNIVYKIVQQADDKILVGGEFINYNGVSENNIIRLNTDGSKDTSFTTGTGFDSTVYTIAQQANGKILVGGNFTTYNSVTENRIISLNSDGSKDDTFNTGTGLNFYVNTIVEQTNGKIFVGGNFTAYKGATENYIISLNTDGSKDATFNTGTGFNNFVGAIVQQADGKIIVGGGYTTYNGVTENRIIRLNSDGSKDATFNTGTGFNNPIYTIAQQIDGKILVGGLFTNYNGVIENRIIRLNTDGSKDATFITGTGFNNYVFQITPQADGKILVGGQFTTYNGVTENRIIRLNSDGSKDVTFNTGIGFSGVVYTIQIQADGKILVGGDFTSYPLVTENKIITLNTDGTKDTAFITGIGFNSSVNTIIQLADDKIIVGGNFITYKGNSTSAYLIKLHTEASLSTTSFDAANAFVIYPNPAQNVLHLQSNNFTTIKAVKIYDLQGKVVLQDTNDTINVSNLAKGLYIVKIATEEGEVTKKFIKE